MVDFRYNYYIEPQKRVFTRKERARVLVMCSLKNLFESFGGLVEFYTEWKNIRLEPMYNLCKIHRPSLQARYSTYTSRRWGENFIFVIYICMYATTKCITVCVYNHIIYQLILLIIMMIIIIITTTRTIRDGGWDKEEVEDDDDQDGDDDQKTKRV